ncbi:hypothetical protein HDU91_002978 [Kappamyces sp. JEL0680]|nr:hypothetical protein HDU91_002978 [Kappamyces sp. JEL0680]
MQDLKEFEKAAFEDPANTEKKVAKEMALKNQHIKDMDTQLAGIQGRFNALELEFEQKVSDRALEIFESSVQKFQSYFDTVTRQVYHENSKLNAEIKKQQELEASLETLIANCKVRKRELVKEVGRQVDPRRNVLNLHQHMTCTPEMEVVLN